MTFIYDRAQLKSAVNREIHQRIGMLDDVDETINRGVRGSFAKRDFASARRKVALAPDLFNGIFDYAAPSDLSGHKIIDIPAQAKRQDGDFSLIPSSEFSINHRRGDIAVRDYNGITVLQIDSNVDSKQVVASELDSLTSGSSDGTSWAVFGSSTAIEADDADFVKGSGSIKFSFPAASPTAGIQHAAISPVDLSDYLDGTSSWFMWAKIPSITGLTSLNLRFGTDSSNYYLKSVTAQHDGSAFVAGWNLLRFDLSSLSTTGTPTNTNIVYFVPYLVGTGALLAGDMKFDWLTLMKGVKHDVEYYGSSGWVNSSGAYLENSTDDADLLVAYADEFEIIVLDCSILAAREIKDRELASDLKVDVQEVWRPYTLSNPSEAKIMTNEYHRFITT